MPTTDVTLFQKSLKMGLNPLLQAKLGAEKTQFMIFPEYFFVDQNLSDHKSSVDSAQKGLNWLLELSQSYEGIIIGGSIIREHDNKYYNSTPVIQNGQVIDFYDKRNLNADEAGFLSPGSEPGIFLLSNTRFAVLTSDDVKKDEYFEELAGQNIRLVFMPFTAVSKDDDSAEKQAARDNDLFVERARKYNLTIIKCSAVGSLYAHELQGRSLIASPSGITWRIGAEESDKEITKRCTIVYPRVNAATSA